MRSDAQLVIGLGGNLGGDAAVAERFAQATAELEALFGPAHQARRLRTAPLGRLHQPWFLNTALSFEVAGDSPVEVIEKVLALEAALGRDRTAEPRFGARPIDLDVLVWGSRRGTWPGPPAVTLPHPRLIDRRFALMAIAELRGEDACIPGEARTVAELLATVAHQRVEIAS